MIKPDGVQRQLVGKIIQRFEDKGYKLIAMKMMRPSREQFERHYADLAGRGFFAGLVSYMVCACACRSFSYVSRIGAAASVERTPAIVGSDTRAAAAVLVGAGAHPLSARVHSYYHFAFHSCSCMFHCCAQLSGPVVGMVWQGADAVAGGRRLLGATRPSDSAPGTIRGDFAIDVGRYV